MFEGILVFYDERIRNLFDIKIFVLTDDDIRFARRLKRDLKERGRDIPSVIVQYNRFVKDSYDKFIKPSMKYCDLIIPNLRASKLAINFVSDNIIKMAG